MNINLNQTNISKVRAGCKDVFHAFMVEDAVFDGYYDIPFIPQDFELHVKKLIAYDKTFHHSYESGEVVHFYLDDQKFDGPRGIWNGLSSNEKQKRGFDLARFEGAHAIIAPDFSLYLDMPRVMQIWNVYRSRAIGYYLTKKGYSVIPNVRWTDDESYDYALAGLYYGQIVAVGTLGCSRDNCDKYLLVKGFIEMIKRINPKIVLIYGPICKELKYVIEKYKVNILHFDSETQAFFRSKTHGNEK